MSGSWRDSELSTPERIKAGSRALLRHARSGRAAGAALAVVAVALVSALTASALTGTREDPGPAPAGAPTPTTISTSEPSPPATPEPAVEESEVADGSEPAEEPDPAPAPDALDPGRYRVAAAGQDGCLGLSAHDSGRVVLAWLESCDPYARTMLVIREVAGDRLVIGFSHSDFRDHCLQPDGPDPDSDEAGTDAVYYFAPYRCEPGKPAQQLTLIPVGGDEYQLRTVADQCLDRQDGRDFAGGTIVATSRCDGSSSQLLQFRPSERSRTCQPSPCTDRPIT